MTTTAIICITLVVDSKWKKKDISDMLEEGGICTRDEDIHEQYILKGGSTRQYYIEASDDFNYNSNSDTITKDIKIEMAKLGMTLYEGYVDLYVHDSSTTMMDE